MVEREACLACHQTASRSTPFYQIGDMKMFSKNIKIQKLLEYAKEIKSLDGISSLLSWDQNTGMPANASNARGYQRGLMASIEHEKLTNKAFGKVVQDLETEIYNTPEKFTLYDKALIRESKRLYDEATKLSEKFVRKYEEITSKAFGSWKDAKTAGNFQLFANDLANVVDLKLEETEYIGYESSPYDALLNQYEPGLTEKLVAEIFDPLKSFSLDFLKKIQLSKITIDTSILNREYDSQKQLEVSKEIAQGIGFNFDSGRLDQAPHPFTTYIGTSDDVRITTRVIKDYIPYSILAAIHECGHGMYEQNIDKQLALTYLSRGISYGIHESQSRMWENMIGRSPEFWEFWFTKLQVKFPTILKMDEKDVFIKALNKVTPDLIRVDANEVTYNLHIILRFEIEKALLTKQISVRDLPEIWNSKTKEYFGLIPKNDAEGVLQDIHWSKGSFGYFPTYTLGNIYAAQFWNTIREKLPALKSDLQAGNFSNLNTWLKENIQKYGKAYTADEICIKVTGEKLNSKYLIEYIGNKFSRIYTDIK